MTRQKKQRMVVTGIACGVLAVPMLACGLVDEMKHEAFTNTCTNECAANGSRASCATYCECTWEWANDNGRMEELERLAQTGGGGSGTAPVQIDAMVACGDSMLDEFFLTGCREGCEAGDCETQCTCMLGELRGTGDRAESTRFFMENLISDPPTPAGQARLDQATTRCVQVN